MAARRGKGPSLFSRLLRYQPLAKHGQYENQHTEALAAALEAGPNFAQRLLECCLEPSWELTASVSVTSQAPAHGRERVDLQIRVGQPGVPAALVWIEVKVGEERVGRHLSGEDQLHGYDAELRARPGLRRQLVHLRRADTARVSEDARPCGLKELTWQEVGLAAHAAQETSPNPTTEQFLRFLTERNLAVTDPITTVDLLVAEQKRTSETAWQGLVDQISLAVDNRWTEKHDSPIDRDSQGRPFTLGGGPFYDVRERPGRPARGDAYCEWTIRPGEHIDDPRLWFYAGVTLMSWSSGLDDALRRSAGDSDLQVFTGEGRPRSLRVFSPRPAAHLLAFETLDEQVQDTAKWAYESMIRGAQLLESSPEWGEPTG